MKDMENILEDFHSKADPAKAVFDLFSRAVSMQATLASLKDLVFENLKICAGKDEKELLSEFESFYFEHGREILTDFISKYGKMQ